MISPATPHDPPERREPVGPLKPAEPAADADPRVAVLKAWLPALNGDEAARLAIADEVASMPGGTVPAENLRARTLLESGRPLADVAEQVQASLDRVLAIEPNDIEARFLAAIHRSQREPAPRRTPRRSSADAARPAPPRTVPAD